MVLPFEFPPGVLMIATRLEFFTVPEYFNDVPSTQQCLANLKDLTGQWPPMRVGGTTQWDSSHKVHFHWLLLIKFQGPGDLRSVFVRSSHLLCR